MICGISLSKQEHEAFRCRNSGRSRADAPRRGNATRHDLHEISFPSTVCGGEGRTLFRSGDRGVPASVSCPRARDSEPRRLLRPLRRKWSLGAVLLRLAGGWAERLGDGVTATDGKALRRSFANASARSPLHLVQALASEGDSSRPDRGTGQVERDHRDACPSRPSGPDG